MKFEIAGRPSLGIAFALVIGLTSVRYPVNLSLLLIPFWIYPGLPMRIGMAASFLIGTLTAPLPAPPLAAKTPFDGVATIVSPPNLWPDHESFLSEIEGARIYTIVSGQPRLCLGERVHISGSLRPPDPLAAPAFANRGWSGRVSLKGCEVVAKAPWPLELGESWRRSFLDFATQALGPDQGGLLAGLCFNAENLVDDVTKSEMRHTGTFHLLSASGLHVFLISAALLAVLALFPIPRAIQLAAVAAVLILYVLATGLSPPVVRASFMVIAASAAYLFAREPDALSALACAAIGFLLWQPQAVYNPGFQLSMIAVGAFAIAQRRARPESRSALDAGMAKLGSVIFSSLIASLATAPILAYYFGQISIISIVSNLLVEMVMPAVLIGSLSAHLVSGIGWPVAAWVVSVPVHGWLGWMIGVLDVTNRVSVVRLGEFSAYWLLPIYGGLLALGEARVRQP